MDYPKLELEIENNFIHSYGSYLDGKVFFPMGISDEFENSKGLCFKLNLILREYPHNYCLPVKNLSSRLQKTEKNIIRTLIKKHNIRLNSFKNKQN